ncbi:MAG: 50S ribosomal protein L31 [Candidatus Yanofskybacteria bacterium RIFCSPHIGHO2_02_FULL_44_12b]|uniref:Large ribosomal subunit protein bL31 n=1 Tax=Candidatus Yanofskybacteria bacterium RIFCSPLOWO2_01_FULL_44_22 TaxID=1802697 RepID=A0A1F8GJD3_9BACT|nr:MAG: 50S ribosomal protein L31 [Candidatus Yanofskybacteria bacterium RIFCSPHIGHO2_01_FULL_44_24]OGN16006.1 MAG: 50S ribosomal protein L31 [Candidatus Yanofskybacteria bacterium RIFCSPHIGHO2_02_FULL_44_12b]OGN25517.1 MAG: 50S ribosomal protein L31 [Candidatus Yanofskybacteria bacterium RIFCSPLOWO2_01_FULL_44_22]
MRQDIHPNYHPKAKITCACGHEWVTGSTMPELSVNICANCHPFYTGQEKIVDTRGRVEKFKKRMEKSRGKARHRNPKS